MGASLSSTESPTVIEIRNNFQIVLGALHTVTNQIYPILINLDEVVRGIVINGNSSDGLLPVLIELGINLTTVNNVFEDLLSIMTDMAIRSPVFQTELHHLGLVCDSWEIQIHDLIEFLEDLLQIIRQRNGQQNIPVSRMIHSLLDGLNSMINSNPTRELYAEKISALQPIERYDGIRLVDSIYEPSRDGGPGYPNENRSMDSNQIERIWREQALYEMTGLPLPESYPIWVRRPSRTVAIANQDQLGPPESTHMSPVSLEKSQEVSAYSYPPEIMNSTSESLPQNQQNSEDDFWISYAPASPTIPDHLISSEDNTTRYSDTHTEDEFYNNIVYAYVEDDESNTRQTEEQVPDLIFFCSNPTCVEINCQDHQ
ncbi:unnamed protein product [Orchesella dallaii]|uniref:Uncharacterized protein n=1 Tax=Orchesella dallaii TaxID=48710 RepID=A0ABP1S6W1_9HEXA